MTYKQLMKLDYESLCYNQFLCTCALYKRIPFKALLYDSEKESTTLIIFSRTQSETVTTRRMKFSKAGAKVIVEYLKRDFVNIEIEVMNELCA